jgi:hypothetical protein
MILLTLCHGGWRGDRRQKAELTLPLQMYQRMLRISAGIDDFYELDCDGTVTVNVLCSPYLHLVTDSDRIYTPFVTVFVGSDTKTLPKLLSHRADFC